MATALKPELCEPLSAPIDPTVKGWIDRVIVPALVKAYLRENSLAPKTDLSDNRALTLVSAKGSKR